MTLKIAIQKKGRLSDESKMFLSRNGIVFNQREKELIVKTQKANVEIVLTRDDDIPKLVADGIVDIGIVGLDCVLESGQNVRIEKRLGFGKCKLAIALEEGTDYANINWLNGMKFATSFPKVCADFFQKQHLNVELIELAGSVEIAPRLGIADGIIDLVSSGETLRANGLKAVRTVLEVEAVLISNLAISNVKKVFIKNLINENT